MPGFNLTTKGNLKLVATKLPPPQGTSAKFCGTARYDKNFITHAMIQMGGKLEFFLSDKPTSWGSKAISRATGLQ